MITEFVMTTISYVEKHLQAESVASILFFFCLAMAFLLAIILILLAFRKTRLWYWKTEEQLKTLQGIDIRLAEIKQGVDNVHKSVESLKKVQIIDDGSIQTLDKNDDDKEAEVEINSQMKNQGEDTAIVVKFEETDFTKEESSCDTCEENAQEEEDKQTQMPKHKREPNVGKSGTVYEDDILRQQIRY